jgi:hypothetical protein
MAEVIERIISLAKDAGLEGKELADFLRDERAFQRDEARWKAEERLLQQKREAEREQREADEKRRQHELDLARLKLEMLKKKKQSRHQGAQPASRSDGDTSPKLPHFDVTKDDFDAYLHSWSSNFSALLTGVVLQAMKDLTTSAKQHLEVQGNIQSKPCAKMTSQKADDPGVTSQQCEEYVTLKNGMKVPVVRNKDRLWLRGIDNKLIDVVVASSCKESDKKMPVMRGYIGETEREVTVLRDTGCSGAVVRKDLCKPEDFTGEVKLCLMMDGQAIQAPVVNVQVDTPYYTGKMEALAMVKPLCDVVIGNIPGARDPSNPSHVNFHKKRQTHAVHRNGGDARPVLGTSRQPYHRHYNIRTSRTYIPLRYRRCRMDFEHIRTDGSHAGPHEMLDGIRKDFYWPGMLEDVITFCEECSTCQYKSSPRNITHQRQWF